MRLCRRTQGLDPSASGQPPLQKSSRQCELMVTYEISCTERRTLAATVVNQQLDFGASSCYNAYLLVSLYSACGQAYNFQVTHQGGMSGTYHPNTCNDNAVSGRSSSSILGVTSQMTPTCWAAAAALLDHSEFVCWFWCRYVPRGISPDCFGMMPRTRGGLVSHRGTNILILGPLVWSNIAVSLLLRKYWTMMRLVILPFF